MFSTCTHIKATENLCNKIVEIKYCLTHYNHENKSAFLKVSAETQLKIACKLQKGVTIKRIFDDIREKHKGKLGREHLVNLQDVRNIKLISITLKA